MVKTPAFFLPRCVALLSVLTAGATAAPTETPALASFHANVQPLLVKYCYDCHGDGAAKGKVAFDGFKSDAELIAQTSLWLTALKNVRAGLMPPEDEARPTSEEVKSLENWVKYQAFGIDPARPDPGRVTVRRLNRVEYGNTIRELMGINFNSEVEFPPDDTGHGFDNLGEVLTVSPLLLEKYLQAAEEVVDQAVPRVGRVPAKQVALGRDFRKEERAVNPASPEAANPPVAAAAAGAGRGGNRDARNDLNTRRGGKASYTFTVKEAGAYKLAFKAEVRSSFDFETSRATMIFAVDDQEKARREIAWDAKPILLETEYTWEPGPHRVTVELQPIAQIEAAKPKPEPETEPELPAPAPLVAAVATPPKPETPALATLVAGVAVSAPLPGVGGVAPAAPAANFRPPAVRSVDLRITSAELLGPMDEKRWIPPDNYRRFFPEDVPATPEARDAYARKVLRDFATRAFRRPADEAKVTQLAAIARSVYSQPGKRFEDGIARAMMGTIASPRFLFRVEEPASGEASERFASVDEYALASRLSFFLWSSMPDEELFALAARGALRKELPAQVARMIKDPKSQAFVRNFPGQWLQARDIDTVPINAKAVLGLADVRGNRANRVDLDNAMRKAMRTETEMVFDYVMHEDRSVLEFIDADYTFLNAKLATHYGLPAVEGDNLRRVTLPPGSPRGGFLTQGTILAVTSNPTRTSPVKRGLFVLENILGTPPPPPPPDIPPLEESKKNADGKEFTLREILAEHRSNALCSSCHSRMDPLGFALENFNALGNWRELDAKQPIDPSGKLTTGEAFADIRELKHIITHERRLDYYRCLAEKMLTYALGRSLEYYDVHTLDQLVARLEQDQGRFSSLLTGIIESVPFQKLRNTQVAAVVTDASNSSSSSRVLHP